MFALCRVAVRAVQHQPTRQLSTLRSTAFTLRIEACRPSPCRSFHKSRQWLAEEERNTTESSAEQQAGKPVTVEPSAEEQKEIKEESVATPEVADAAADGQTSAKDVAKQVSQQLENTRDAAKDALSSAAETVSNTIARATRTPRFPNNSKPGQSNKILYIGNLFFEVTTAQLEAEFARFGEILQSRIVTDQNGMSKGFGYLEFVDRESAERALRELDQTVFQGRRMGVQFHEPRDKNQSRPTRPENRPSKTLYIGNMSFQMSDRDLNDLFREIRNVLDVRVAIDRRTGQPRGFAHADFIDVASAEKAKAFLSQKTVYGRQLRVDFSSAPAHSADSSA